MRKIIFIVSALVISVLASAQTQEPLPVDPNVKYGKLDNGLTYYIRHNKYPEKRADFYIAQKVGSMQEEDSQAGLAHFLEHMAFNGTKHFKGRKTMLNYLETIGAKFGANVNAYTGFDETVYTLNDIPVVREGIVDSCLLVLHDWSSFIELENDEIDKERSIIKEEWRTRSGARTRIWDKQLPVIFKDSKYADRMPIGKMEVVENFEYQVIKDYYHKWYRPDLQAIIIVGDIDAEKVESQIKKMFSDIPKAVDPAERIYYEVPDNVEPIVSIVSDKEETIVRVTHYIKHDVLPNDVKQTKVGFVHNQITELATAMLSERFSEISQSADAPFTTSGVYNSGFFVAKSKDAWTNVAFSKEDKIKETVACFIRETERAKRFGFTDGELERAKANILKSYEQSYNNREKQQNNNYTREYVSSFGNYEPIPGIEYEYNLLQEVLPTITSQLVNSYIAELLTNENNVITITGPEKPGIVYPTEAEILDTFKTVQAEEIDGYIEELITDPLMSEIPTAGEIVSETHDDAIDATVWLLSNGMRVAFKTTDFKDDQILMNSRAYGGFSWAEESEMHDASMASMVPYMGGIGSFSSNDLKKVLAGKAANINASIDSWTQSINGNSSINDFETLMQLTNLYFTAPRKDDGMFTNMKGMIASRLRNSAATPSYVFDLQLTFARYGFNPRYTPMRPDDVSKLDYDAIIDFYKRAYANPGSFVFTFIGNVDKAQLKPFVETYLASLPTGDKNAKYKDIDASIRRGKYANTFEQKMEEPKTTAYTLYTIDMPYTMDNANKVNAMKQILDIVYVRTIREAEGGTYGVRVGASVSRIPEEASLRMSFDTDPDKVAKLAPMVHDELMKIAENGPEDEDFQKVKEYMVKKYEEDIKTNGYWSHIVSTKLFYGDDFHSNALESIRAISKDDIKTIANMFVSSGNQIDVIMNPLK